MKNKYLPEADGERMTKDEHDILEPRKEREPMKVKAWIQMGCERREVTFDVSDEEMERVSFTICQSPDELPDYDGVDMAYLDGSHNPEIVGAEIWWVMNSAADECLIVIDNARDKGYPELEAMLEEYTAYPNLSLDTMAGFHLIQYKKE